jgi:hypothetical protein
MDPQMPIEPLIPSPRPSSESPPRPAAPSATASPLRLGGIRRSMATVGLAMGLLAIGGAAVVLAAGPEPSSGATPGTTPSTQPSTDDDSTSTDRPHGGDCPEDGTDGSDGTDGQDGQDPAASPSTDTST